MIPTSDKKQTLLAAVSAPCMVLAASGIVLAIGYALCPQSMQGGLVTGMFGRLGLLLVRIAGALTDNAGFLFAASAAIAYTKDHKPEGALFGIGAFLILSALSSSYVVAAILPFAALPAESLVYLPAPLSGFLCGRLAAAVRNSTGSDWTLAILRLLVAAAICSMILIGIWMAAWSLVTALGTPLMDGSVGSIALFTILNRFLMPFDLHHGLNQVVLFQKGSGDLVRYWANQTAGDPGRYMSGFFAPMMFGIPSIACYLSRTVNLKQDRKRLLFCAALCSFLIGFSEPLEFLLFFTIPGFYLLYCLLYGLFGALASISGFRAGFALSGGLCDLIFSAACPAASRTWLIIPLGLAAAVIFYGACWIIDRRKTSENR